MVVKQAAIAYFKRIKISVKARCCLVRVPHAKIVHMSSAATNLLATYRYIYTFI